MTPNTRSPWWMRWPSDQALGWFQLGIALVVLVVMTVEIFDHHVLLAAVDGGVWCIFSGRAGAGIRRWRHK